MTRFPSPATGPDLDKERSEALGYLITLIGRAKKATDVLFFTENIDKEQKKRSSLFLMRPLIFSEAVGFCLLRLYVNAALLTTHI